MYEHNPITRITLFGALEIAHAPAAPRRPPTQRVLALLGYLIAHHDVPQARDKLVDLLWPELPPRQGRRMLSDTLWRARRLLTPPSHDDTTALLIAGDTVAFRPDPSIWVDLIAFEQVLAATSDPTSGSIDQLITRLRHIVMRDQVAQQREHALGRRATRRGQVVGDLQRPEDGDAGDYFAHGRA